MSLLVTPLQSHLHGVAGLQLSDADRSISNIFIWEAIAAVSGEAAARVLPVVLGDAALQLSWMLRIP